MKILYLYGCVWNVCGRRQPFSKLIAIVEESIDIKESVLLQSFAVNTERTPLCFSTPMFAVFHNAKLHSTFIWLAKQVALGGAYARSGVLCRFFWGVSAERCDHEHVLAVFAGTAASFSGSQRSDRQRSRGGLLPLPLRLPVSTKYGGRAIGFIRCWCLGVRISFCNTTRSSPARKRRIMYFY